MKYLVVLLLLGGCASASQTYTPSGKLGHSINCSGGALSWGQCFEKAGEICGARGYDVIDRSDQQGSNLVANRYGLYGGTLMNRSMLIACK